MLDLIVWGAPITVASAALLWWLHLQDRKRDTRTPKPRLRLSLVLAATATITAVGSSYLAVATALFRAGHPLPADWGQVTLAVIFALELPPVVMVGYLLWLNWDGKGV